MLPRETVLAVFPDRVRAGGASFEPVTLRHVVALSALGVDPEGGNDAARTALGAWVMSLWSDELAAVVRGDPDECGRKCERWLASLTRPDDAVAAAWGMLSDSASTYIPPKKDGKSISGPRGCGWPLEVGEFIASEYGVSFDEAMDTPLSTAMALVSVARKRGGGEHGGPDYYERVEMAAMTEFARRMKGGGDDGGGH